MSLLALLAAVAIAQAAPAADCARVADKDAAVCAALAASNAGRFGESAAAFEKAASADPSNAARLLAAAGNMWLAAGQPGKAALAIDRALSGGLAAGQRGGALLDRARAAEALGDLKGARTRITEATPMIGDDPFLWYFSASLALRENDEPLAKRAIARALALAPNDSTILFEAGHVAYFGGDEARARDYWNRAAAADPQGRTGQAAREALALLPAPITVKAD